VKPAVFLDRDGTLVEDIGYLRRVEEVAVYPWTVDAVRALNRAGLPVVVITNQSGVARGFITEAIIGQVHAHLSSVLEAGGARIDAYYYCPHHPDGTIEPYARRCDCRKPGRGLIDRAAGELGLDPARSFVVGDKWLDVGLARAVGARGLLVRTGYGATEEMDPQPGLVADAIVNNLVEAASWILLQC
jgi:D-glycero-D-manno-heptose 1,7-bisphosphate phosphatase